MARYKRGQGKTMTSTGFRLSVSDENIKLSYYDQYDLFEKGREKDLVKYVREIKSAMRASYEYKKLMKFLKNYCNMDHCGVHNNISAEDGFRIEIHHVPFSAEPVILTVLRKRYANNESIAMQPVLNELMLLHYLKMIGLYPLDDLCHHYYHKCEENPLFIPNHLTFGEPEKFYEAYKDHMEEPLRNKWINSEILTEAYQRIGESNIPKDLYAQNVYVVNSKGEPYLSVTHFIKYLEELKVLKI